MEIQASADPDLVFLTMRGRVFYNNALSKLLTKFQIAADPHGCRSSFSVWAAETRVDFDIAETCLAHAVGSQVSRDYRRTDLYNARARVMEDWGRFAVPARSDPHLEPVAVPAADRTSVNHRVFSSNVDGRDFVVGDVHGCFRTLERALDALHFDPKCDRLFGVGNLVNRGPHAAKALEWLERRFEAVVLGNHDRAALCWFEARRGTAAPTDSQWLDAVPSADHRRWGDALAAMPLAITIATPYGTVGVVHADVPHRVWSQATSMFESDDASAADVALLGLDAASEAIRRHQAQSVEGLTALVHGHDAGKTVRHSANRWNIDTGAGFLPLVVWSFHLWQDACFRALRYRAFCAGTASLPCPMVCAGRSAIGARPTESLSTLPRRVSRITFPGSTSWMVRDRISMLPESRSWKIGVATWLNRHDLAPVVR